MSHSSIPVNTVVHTAQVLIFLKDFFFLHSKDTYVCLRHLKYSTEHNPSH